MSARNQEILARFDAGEVLQNIADGYGITRERVRQIVTKNGRAPRMAAMTKRRNGRADEIARLAETGHTYKQITEKTGLGYQYVSQICHERGIEVDRMSLTERLELLRLAAKVANGASILAVTPSHSDAERLRRFCEREGIASKHGRWRSFDARERIVREGRGSRKTWEHIAAAVSEAEGRLVGANAIYVWATRRGIGGGYPATRRTAAQKPARSSEAALVLIDGEDVREACIRLKPVASASRIAAALGISRNAVIGYWWRGKHGNVRMLPEGARVA